MPRRNLGEPLDDDGPNWIRATWFKAIENNRMSFLIRYHEIFSMIRTYDLTIIRAFSGVEKKEDGGLTPIPD
jgi:hypothetical protein